MKEYESRMRLKKSDLGLPAPTSTPLSKAPVAVPTVLFTPPVAAPVPFCNVSVPAPTTFCVVVAGGVCLAPLPAGFFAAPAGVAVPCLAPAGEALAAPPVAPPTGVFFAAETGVFAAPVDGALLAAAGVEGFLTADWAVAGFFTAFVPVAEVSGAFGAAFCEPIGV